MNERTTNTFSSLSNTFDVEDAVDTSLNHVRDVTIAVEPPENTTYEDDAEVVRQTLYNLLREGESAFRDLNRIAAAEESPRSFEVLNSMLTNISDIAMKLMEVHEKKEKLRKSKSVIDAPGAVNNGTVNNNTVFVGTTSDLQEALKQLKLK